MKSMSADQLRRAFTDFFVARDHRLVPSASLIPIDPTLLFTNSGMVPFKPYFVGEEPAPYPRVTSVQKSVRAGGKHNDLDDVGRTNRHFTFFEMLGNFSFGDYFKAEVIPWAWEFVTAVLEIPVDRLWVTVHLSDDDAAAIWTDKVGIAPERVQRLDADNFWRMGEIGPCGPCSEIFYDLGPEFGVEGGPATGSDRYIEIWNLVFMQYEERAGGERLDLPKPCVDTGAGLERMLFVVQGKPNIWETDAFMPLIRAAEQVTGAKYGTDETTNISLRIIAEHARTMTFLIGDGVRPSNQERGYVLRRIIRRAVRHAFLLGAYGVVTPTMVDAVVAEMGTAYPELHKSQAFVRKIVEHEETSFRRTLERGLERLDGVLAAGDVTGDEAFFLHDTLGFPVDLTREIADERGRAIDLVGFQALLAEQSARARAAYKEAGGAAAAPVEVYREILDEFGATEFTGRQEYVTEGATVVALVRNGERLGRVGVRSGDAGNMVDVFLDRTPFYAESGGQIGDIGTITLDGATVRVLDTVYAIPGLLTMHRAEVVDGELSEGETCSAAIDGDRRNATRRNHTATHLLQWALRTVLGDHVQQAGSSVGPDRLRFDFNHFASLTDDELRAAEDLVNREIITDAPVRHFETTKSEAEALGAIAFFGDKYGDIVRVLEAGTHSVELCGGTHVHALGFIGPFRIVSEGSIASGVRRIEAVTGTGALEYIDSREDLLRQAATSLRGTPAELPEKIERLVGQVKTLEQELAGLRDRAAQETAGSLAATATNGVVVARHDGASPDDLRRLAIATRDALGSAIVALVGLGADGAKAGLVVAVSADRQAQGYSASVIAGPAAKALGGGTAKNAELVIGGGPNVDAVGTALELLQSSATSPAG
ncbi:MAG: alanine--tRNA ligase [Acidimicrobiia bacterium]